MQRIQEYYLLSCIKFSRIYLYLTINGRLLSVNNAIVSAFSQLVFLLNFCCTFLCILVIWFKKFEL